MAAYIAKRLLQTVIVIFGITLITFILLQVVSGDPVAMMLERRATPETIAAVRHQLGLDIPLSRQYVNFISGVVRMDFGVSYFSKEPVILALSRAFRVTLKLAIISFL